MADPDRKSAFGLNVAWMAAGNWIEQAISFAVFVALARILGAEAFGYAAMAASFVILAEFLVRETLTEWLIAEPEPEPGHYDALFWVLGAVSLVIFAVIYLGADLVARLYGVDELAELIRVLAVVVPMIGFTSVQVAVLRRNARFDILGLRAVVGIFLGGIVGLTLAFQGAGVWSLIALRVVQVAGNVVVAWFFSGWRPGFQGTFAHVRDFLGMGLSTLWLQAAHLVSVQSATVIFGATLGPVAAGYFSLAWRLTEIVTFLVNVPLAMVSQTAFASLRRAGQDVGLFMDSVLRVTTLLSLAIFAGLAFLAGPFVRFCFGPEWLPAVPMVQILCIVGLYKSVERIQHAFCLACGPIAGVGGDHHARGACRDRDDAGGGVPWGAEAVTLAFAVRFLLFWPLRFSYASRFGGTGTVAFLGILLPGLGATLAMVAVLALLTHGLGLDPYRLPWLAACILAGAVTFLGFVAVFLPKRLETARKLLKMGYRSVGDRPGRPGRGQSSLNHVLRLIEKAPR